MTAPTQDPSGQAQRRQFPWAIVPIVLVVVVVVGALALRRGDPGVAKFSNGKPHGTRVTILAPPGVAGQVVMLVAGDTSAEVAGDGSTLGLRNEIPQLVAAMDSAGSPVLLAIAPPGSSVQELSAQSTAEALVYCTPFLCPADAESGARLQAVVRESPEVRELAGLIEARTTGPIGDLVSNDSEVEQVLANARRSAAIRLAGYTADYGELRLASWESVVAEGDDWGISAQLTTPERIRISNGKRRWLVVKGLPSSNAFTIVPSNPSLLSVVGAFSGWRSSAEFDVTDSSPDIRVYGWGLSGPDYVNAIHGPGDSAALSEALVLTVVFDGMMNVALTVAGVTADWSGSPRWMSSGYGILTKLNAGRLAASVQNRIERGDFVGALTALVGPLIDVFVERSAEIAIELARAAFDSTASSGQIESALRSVLAGGLGLGKIKAVADVAALVFDNAGSGIVLGVTLVPGAGDGPTDQELVQAAVWHSLPESPACTSIDVRGDWAMAIIPETNDAEGAGVLLQRDLHGGSWVVCDYGTFLLGLGEEYGVPREHWEDWGIGTNESGYQPDRKTGLRLSDQRTMVEQAIESLLGSDFDFDKLGDIDFQGKWARAYYGGDVMRPFLLHKESDYYNVVGQGTDADMVEITRQLGVPEHVRAAWGYD